MSRTNIFLILTRLQKAAFGWGMNGLSGLSLKVILDGFKAMILAVVRINHLNSSIFVIV